MKAKKEAPPVSGSSSLFDAGMLQQLHTVFSRMANPLVLRLSLDNRPVSAELRSYMEALVSLTDKLSMEILDGGEDAPVVQVCRADGRETGLAFHGVPGGHEFTSFVLGLYNAAGPGQALDEVTRQQIASIIKPTDIKILVTLSCTMCPDLVMAAQRIAAENANVTAHVYDLRYFEDLKNRYNVMSVPCMIINNEKVLFGKKNISQILTALLD